MKDNTMNNPTPETIRKAIRQEFAFLIETYGYLDVPVSPSSDEIYAEVHFMKEDWRIAVLTTAHGSRATVQIISPKSQRGSFYHLVDSKATKVARSEIEADLFGDIRYQAQCLREYGVPILEGDQRDFESVFKLISEKQRKWLVKSGIMSEAELNRWEQQQGGD
jgi:hypothetical protein